MVQSHSHLQNQPFHGRGTPDFEEPVLITPIMVTPGSASGNPLAPSTYEDFRKIIEEAPAPGQSVDRQPFNDQGGRYRTGDRGEV